MCEHTHAAQCEGLTGDDASQARSLLALQLEALPSLRGMVFQRGPWALRRVSDLEAALVDSVSPEESLAVSLVARAFSGCTDAGLLGQATTSNLCENAGTGTVDGVAGAQCAALDGPCQRGYFDDARGCCDVVYSVEGASCALTTTSGVCDAIGNCGDTTEFARTNAYAWSETLPAVGAMRRVGDWYITDMELTPDGASIVREDILYSVLRLAYTNDGSDPETSPTREERGAIRVPATSNGRVSVAVLHAATEGVDGVLAHTDRTGIRTLLIDRRLVEGESLSVTVTRASMETIGYLGADGTTIPAGLTEVVNCAGTTDPNVDAAALASDEVRCTFTEEGLVAVEGEGLSAAYVAVAGAEFDVRPAGYFAPRRVRPVQEVARGGDPRIQQPITCSSLWRQCTTSCGTAGTQTCSGAGVWTTCTRPETCNGVDDDCDGAKDEGGATLCNDGMSCTVDECRAISYGVNACRNTAAAAVCRRGACTQGYCNGVADSIVPSPTVTNVVPQNASGCSYREFDLYCETQWDRCSCNGRARCEGARGPAWNGFSAASSCVGAACGTITGLLAENQDDLDTFLTSCRDRGPLEPLLVGGPPAIHNGGCETDGNVCTIDDMCFEPDPSNSLCRQLVMNPGLRQLQVQLLGVTGFTPSSSTIDGLPVRCAGTIGTVALPPEPYDQLCRPDGLPCTVPHSSLGMCNPATGACMPNTPSPIGSTYNPGETVGATWAGDRFVSVPGANCEGDALRLGSATDPSRSSCYQEQCTGTGLCEAFAYAPACNTTTMPGGTCGGARRCVGFAGLATATGPLLNPASWGPATYRADTVSHGQFIGCQRTTACYLGSTNGCVSPGDTIDYSTARLRSGCLRPELSTVQYRSEH